jgi:quercetin dioxygenase-like cupin family protein
MAMHHANPAEIFDLAPLGTSLKAARTTAIVKSEMFEAVRLVVQAGVDIKPHKVDGPITVHCLEGRAMLGLPDQTLELSTGQWVYLEGGIWHSIKGIENTSLLLTIIFPPRVYAQGRDKDGNDAERATGDQTLDSMLDESLMGTFPASDPVSVSNPSTGVKINRRINSDR